MKFSYGTSVVIWRQIVYKLRGSYDRGTQSPVSHRTWQRQVRTLQLLEFLRSTHLVHFCAVLKIMGSSYNPHITEADFERVLRRCGYGSPEKSTYVFQRFSNAFRKYSLNELAMVLAQLIHESGGFRYREERRYAGVSWHNEYRTSLAKPGKLYHGRGYIQLTWPENYLECSQDLERGDLLLRHPEFVAERIALAMFVSEWYWRVKVRPEMRRHPGCFGATTRAINGALECGPGGDHEKAKQRYRKYLKVCEALGIDDVASESGCY